MLGLLVLGCIVNYDLYEERLAALTDNDGDGFSEEDGDCDDGTTDVSPQNEETCDGVDNNCNGVIDEEASDATFWYSDNDNDGYGDSSYPLEACSPPDGYVGNDDDCDDDNIDIHPGAADTPYDGVDADCAENSDYDADGDGADSNVYGGEDCNDEDPAIGPAAPEGLWDIGIDNDCDGQIDDQVIFDLGGAEIRIDGEYSEDSLGDRVLALPAGWVDSEAWVLATASGANLNAGRVYAWPGSAILEGADTSTADWSTDGEDSDGFMGLGIGYAGSIDEPIILIGEPGANSSTGRVSIWDGASLMGSNAEPQSILSAKAPGGFLGLSLLSEYDHDGDGIYDMVVSAPFDSTNASLSGVVTVFLDPPTLPDELTPDDSNIVFYTDAVGAQMTAFSPGDYDGDGYQDLAVHRNISDTHGGAGLIMTDARAEGSYDVVDAADLKLWGVPALVVDIDADGYGELYGHVGDLDRYDLPLPDKPITGEEDSTNHLTVDKYFITSMMNQTVGYSRTRLVVASSASSDGANHGRVYLPPAQWTGDIQIDEIDLILQGAQAGDMAGTGLSLLEDQDGDGRPEILIGAPGVDNNGSGAGAVYLIPSPR